MDKTGFLDEFSGHEKSANREVHFNDSVTQRLINFNLFLRNRSRTKMVAISEGQKYAHDCEYHYYKSLYENLQYYCVIWF